MIYIGEEVCGTVLEKLERWDCANYLMEKVGDECGTNLSSYSRKITENDVKRSESGGIRSGTCNELNEKNLRQKIKWLRQLDSNQRPSG